MTRQNQNPLQQLEALKRRRLLAFLLCVIAGLTIAFGENVLTGGAQSASPSEEELSAARKAAEASMPRLPADIDERLIKAQFPVLTPLRATSDPFVDKTGVTGPKSAGSILSSGGGGVLRQSPGLGQVVEGAAPSTPDITARIEEWRRNYRAARDANLPPPEKTRIYLLSELTPIGKFTTGGKVDVWFSLEMEKRTFPAKIGTKFYDAELIAVTPSGPTFRMSNGTVRTIAYAPKDDYITTTRDEEPPRREPTSEGERRGTSEPAGGGATAPPSPEKKPGVSGNSLPPQTAGEPAPTDAETAAAKPASKFGGNDDSNPAALTASIPVTSELPLFSGSDRGENLDGRPNEFGFLSAAYRTVSDDGEDLTFNAGISKNTRKHPFTFLAHGARPEDLPPTATPTAEAEPVGLAPEQAQALEATPIEARHEQQQQEEKGRGREVVKESKGKAAPKERLVQATTPVVSYDNTGDADSSDVSAAPTPTPHAPTTENQPATTLPSQVVQKPSNLSPLCDPNYKAELIDTEFTSATTLGNLVDKFNTEFGANIVLDNEVQDIAIRLTITNVPWTQFLRIIMDLNDLGMVCLDGRLVGIAKRTKLTQMEDLKKRSEPIVQEIFRLRYLQPVAGGRVNLAGQTQGGQGATIQSLEDAIRAILRASGDPRADVQRVPGRNELMVAATPEQIKRIRELIERVDRPGYQVLIKALVYTVNENNRLDVGSQLAAVVGNPLQTSLGGFTSLPVTQQSSTGTGSGSNQQQPGGRNPGGIPTLATGSQPPTNGLSAANPVGTFGFSTVIGTSQFAYQLTLAQQRGVVNIQSRPFGIVTDGDTFDLAAGTQIPVVTSSIAGGALTQTGNVQFIEASRIARVTPQVAETEDGRAGFVTLNVQLENNVVDTSLGTFNGLPGVNRQSLQTVLRLRDGETAVIGGLSADSVSNSMTKIPGLGDLPVIGYLFKRKAKQENRDRLYFAITVEVIPQEAQIINVPVPSDALTSPPPPPRAQKPSPYEPKR